MAPIRKKNERMITIKGTPASPGIAIGKVHLYDEGLHIIPQHNIEANTISKEVKRFIFALNRTKDELKKLQKKFTTVVRDEKLDFFKMHLLILDDPFLKDNVLLEITESNKNAEWALYEVMSKYIKSLGSIKDEYLSERSADLYDLAKRIMLNLLKKSRHSLSDIESESIIIAKDLSPSDTADMDKTKIMAFATDRGGRTSHTAIVARALEIPAVVGLESITVKVHENDQIIIDGNNGVVIVNPNETTLKEYKTAQSVFFRYSEDLKKLKLLNAVTIDQKRITLAGNIEIRDEIDSVIDHGGQGIGLFRTEFLYLNRTTLPTENELFLIFKEAVEKVKPHPVVFRTLDLGGDKVGGVYKETNEVNPFLGYRAIRFCLENLDIFHTQLRAILRASFYGNGSIMIPMISSVDEIRKVKEIVETQKEYLRVKGESYKDNIKIGAMIEVPSAAVTIDIISKEVNFVSIGTNDLVQYILAVDRNNSKISNLYDPFHPAVLRLIKDVIKISHENKTKVHICGEMSAEPMSAIVFTGMDIDELSMSAIAIPEIKKLIRSISFSDAKQVVKKILTLKTSKEIRDVLHDFISKKAPDFLYKKII